jgi:prolyl oligopeptidase
MRPSAALNRRLLFASVLCVAPTLALAQTVPPAAPVKDVADTYFGAPVHDPYRWMENLKDPQVEAWMRAQNSYTRSVLDRIPQRDKLVDEIARYGDAASARVTMVQVSGDYIYYQKRNADENIPKLYVRQELKGAERVLVDPDKLLAAAGTHNAIDYYAPSRDNRYVAFGVSSGGSEESVLHIMDVATGKETGDVIDRANDAAPNFLPDNRLLYGRLQKLPPGAPATDKYLYQRLYVHTLGQDPDKDAAILGPGLSARMAIDPAESVVAVNPIGSDYVLAVVSNGVQNEQRIYVAPLATLGKPDMPWTKVAETADDVTGADVIGDTIYLLSHHNAPRFKILKLPLAEPDIGKAEEVVPPSDAVITGLATAKDALYFRQMDGGISELKRLAYTPKARAVYLRLPFQGDIDTLAADTRVPGVLFDGGSWVNFGATYAYSAATGKVTDTGLQPQGRYDNPVGLMSREVKVKAADGTLIPLSIVYRKGLKLDGNNPTILYGYGAYGLSMTPFFRPQYLAWFNRGGVFAVAHVRGGGEYGEDWHKAGYKATKPNTWNDAIACGEWLVANKYTSSARMAIEGGSAGGIFVGRAITTRPDLFAAALDEVPVSDTLREETTANGVPNIPEFGSVKDEEGFKALLGMSPYANVKDGTPYPAVMVESGYNDPRVDVWEAGKMAARLQAATSSGKPILLRIDFDAGHGFGSTKKQRYEEQADNYAFLFWQFGVKGFQP